jgi:hypothetical protein
MIAPNMATMLAFIATDFPLSPDALAHTLREASEESFNMISVDGDMSTNDAVYAFAPPSTSSGQTDVPAVFAGALRAVCLDLAKAMVADGEGATKTLEVRVTQARDVAQARTIARAIINSNLVKTALYGEDPNWGRIIAAAGAARANLDPDRWSLFANGKAWVGVGGIELLSEAEAHRELEPETISVELRLGVGEAHATCPAITCASTRTIARDAARHLQTRADNDRRWRRLRTDRRRRTPLPRLHRRHRGLCPRPRAPGDRSSGCDAGATAGARQQPLSASAVGATRARTGDALGDERGLFL